MTPEFQHLLVDAMFVNRKFYHNLSHIYLISAGKKGKLGRGLTVKVPGARNRKPKKEHKILGTLEDYNMQVEDEKQQHLIRLAEEQKAESDAEDAKPKEDGEVNAVMFNANKRILDAHLLSGNYHSTYLATTNHCSLFLNKT